LWLNKRFSAKAYPPPDKGIGTRIVA
jgi:hypothetical protein